MNPYQMRKRAECIRNWLALQVGSELHERLVTEATFLEMMADLYEEELNS